MQPNDWVEDFRVVCLGGSVASTASSTKSPARRFGSCNCGITTEFSESDFTAKAAKRTKGEGAGLFARAAQDHEGFPRAPEAAGDRARG